MSDSDTDEDFDQFVDRMSDLTEGEAEQAGADEEDGEDETVSLEFAGGPETRGLRTTATTDSLGHVTASEGLSVRRGGHQIIGYIRSDTRDALRLGDYIQIPYPGRENEAHAELLTEVIEIGYEQRADIDDKSDIRRGIDGETIDERQYVQAAELDPIAIVEGTDEDDLERSTVDRVPKPFTQIYEATGDSFLQTGLNLPESGPFVGHLAVGGERHPPDDPLAFQLPDGTGSASTPAIYTHTLVTGSTDAGKTHFTKNLYRQLATDQTYEITVTDGGTEDRMLGMVIVDPEAEYSGLGDDPDAGDLPDDVRQRLDEQGIEVGGINTGACGSHDLQTFAPVVDGKSTPDLDNLREFGVPFELVRTNPELIMPFEAEGPTYAAIVDCVDAYFRDATDPSYDGFIDYLDDRGEILVDEHDIHDQSWRAMNNRVDKEYFSDVFDSGTHLLTDISNELFRPGRVTVVPVNHLGDPEDMEMRLVVMALLTYIVENKLATDNPDPHVADTPLLLGLDEAHEFLGDTATVQTRSIVESFRRIAKRGRKYSLGLSLVTQEPTDIDDQIRSQLRTRIYLQLEKEIGEDVPIPGRYAPEDLATFSQGQAVIKAPNVRPVEIRGLDYPVVQHD
jgi:DNA helicase HerA-like ATPase